MVVIVSNGYALHALHLQSLILHGSLWLHFSIGYTSTITLLLLHLHFYFYLHFYYYTYTLVSYFTVVAVVVVGYLVRLSAYGLGKSYFAGMS